MFGIKYKDLNAADWISSVRLLAIPVIVITTLLGLQMITAWVILVALFTDVIDGPIARHYKWETKHGAKLDSVADASLFLTSAFSILWFFKDFFAGYIWEVCLLMGLYFFQLVYSLIKYKQVTAYHTYAAKLAAIIEGLFILSCLFWHPTDLTFYVTLAIGLIEQADEITLLFILPGLQENVKGTYWVLMGKK